jgi:hypothetical protein
MTELIGIVGFLPKNHIFVALHWIQLMLSHQAIHFEDKRELKWNIQNKRSMT